MPCLGGQPPLGDCQAESFRLRNPIAGLNLRFTISESAIEAGG